MEDTKGNSGLKGRMTVTNLRLIWHAVGSPRINMSIGLNCLLTVTTKLVTFGIRGATQALFLLGSYNRTKYEFVFTNLCKNSLRHYTTIIGVYRAYLNSRLYRELKLRGAFIVNKQLQLLPMEQISLNEQGVWNLSSDSGNIGSLVITNIRVVWHADINETFNISLPYIAIESIVIRDSKFGKALVITARLSSGGYVLGFRVDPPEKLGMVHKELKTLHETFTRKPIFGVQYDWNQQNPKPEITDDEFENLQEVGEPKGEMGANLYLASSQGTRDEEQEAVQPVFNAYLGLAIEPLKPGFTIQSLWEVIPSN